MTERRHYRFSGTVQGVGFRYRACWAAQHLGLTGWVENLWDGSVELEAQGEPAALDRLVEAIVRSSRYIELADVRMRAVPPVPGESGFRVR